MSRSPRLGSGMCTANTSWNKSTACLSACSSLKHCDCLWSAPRKKAKAIGTPTQRPSQSQPPLRLKASPRSYGFQDLICMQSSAKWSWEDGSVGNMLASQVLRSCIWIPRTHMLIKSWVWWYTPIIPERARLEVETDGPPEVQGPASLAYLAKFQANKNRCLNPKVKGMASAVVPLPTYTCTYTCTSMHTKKTKENLYANYVNDTTQGCTGPQDSIVRHGRYQPRLTAEQRECGCLTTI